MIQKNYSSKNDLRLLSGFIRLGASLALGISIVLLIINLTSAASTSLNSNNSLGSGDLDVTFGDNGIITTSIGSNNDYDYLQAITMQPDGKILAAGSIYDGSNNSAILVRYTASGTLDTTFGNNGIVTTPLSIADNGIADIVVQSDGKIVAAGFASNNGNYSFALARYTILGTLDTAFGNNGIVTTSIDSGATAQSIIIQPDGKIVAAGYARSGSDYSFALARYTASGILDATFSNDGIITTSVGSSFEIVYGLASQPDGKIIAAGYAYNGSDNDFALARYTVSGSLDTTFGNNGVVTTDIGSNGDSDHGRSVVIQQDGKIVTAGYTDSGFALARYTISGTLDTSFGNSGIVTTSIGSANGRAFDIAIQLDGKIAAVGFAFNGNDLDFALARYTTSGTLDATFGNNGVITTPIGSGYNAAFSIAIQPDRKIVAAGSAYNGNGNDFALARYHAGSFIYLPLVIRN